MKIKKRLATLVVAISLMVTSVVPAMAATVYYRNTPVSWDYGRKLAVYSYSDVCSSAYQHCATANTTTSGWKAPGVKAHAQQYVGTKKATAYWNCR